MGFSIIYTRKNSDDIDLIHFLYGKQILKSPIYIFIYVFMGVGLSIYECVMYYIINTCEI